MASSERALESKLVKACRANGIKAVKGNSESNRGFPDRIIFLEHLEQIHYVELKNNTYYQQTPLQKAWEERISKSGGAYFLLNGDGEVDMYIDYFIKKGDGNGR